MIAGPPVLTTDLPLKLFARGKVRDTYELDYNKLLMVATDRISAFDHVLPNGIPDRGKVLTQLSIFWFSQTDFFQENHLVSGMMPDLPAALRDRTLRLPSVAVCPHPRPAGIRREARPCRRGYCGGCARSSPR